MLPSALCSFVTAHGLRYSHGRLTTADIAHLCARPSGNGSWRHVMEKVCEAWNYWSATDRLVRGIMCCRSNYYYCLELVVYAPLGFIALQKNTVQDS